MPDTLPTTGRAAQVFQTAGRAWQYNLSHLASAQSMLADTLRTTVGTSSRGSCPLLRPAPAQPHPTHPTSHLKRRPRPRAPIRVPQP